MRVWDINPGYLNRQSILGEHRELHGIVSIIKHNKKGYSKHPETLRWLEHGWALSQRHRLLAAEMRLRGYIDRSPVALKKNFQKWPETFIDSPGDQLSILADKYINKPQGRISLPTSVQQLWAQHKYSVMARDVDEYKRIGRWVSARNDDRAMGDLHQELVSLLRHRPTQGGSQNAVQHMWGYVAKYTSITGEMIKKKTVRCLLEEIQRLVFLHGVDYLKESTALSELQAWKY